MITQNFNELIKHYRWNTAELDAVLLLIPQEVQDYWIAGGALRRTVAGESIIGKSDFDFFFKNEEAFATLLDIFYGKGFKISRENAANKTIEGEVLIKGIKEKIEIQLIKIKFYSSAEELLDSFDFTLCQFALDPITNEFYCGDTAMFDVARKQIIVHKIGYPATNSLRRLIKYTAQGYHAGPNCFNSFLEQAKNVVAPLPSPKIGADVAILDEALLRVQERFARPSIEVAPPNTYPVVQQNP